MFTLYYATRYIFQSLKVNGFSTGVATFANNNFAPANELNSPMKSPPALTAGNDFTRPPYHIIHTRARTANTCASAHIRTGCQCIPWLSIWMSELFNNRGNSRGRLSIWGGCKDRYELLPQWADWHILLFLSHSPFKCTLFAWVGGGNCKASIQFVQTLTIHNW